MTMTELLQPPFNLYMLAATLALFIGWLLAYLAYRSKMTAFRHQRETDALSYAAKQSERDSLLQQHIHQRDVELSGLRAEIAAKEERNASLQLELVGLLEFKQGYVQLEARMQEQQQQQAHEKQLLTETKMQLFKEFEFAANKLFEAKQSQFSQSSRAHLEAILNPFKDQIKDFNKRVEDVYHKENSQRNQLLGQIKELHKQAQKIGSDANSLAAALKGDNKAVGDWGEIILERLLEQSGLVKGREYEAQKSHFSESGQKFRPDIVVHLPEGKDIVIDAKVSLLDYERYSQSVEGSDRELALKRHVDSLRAHIKGLSVKKYEQLENVRSLDFVFIFVPVEAAYIAAIQAAPVLFKEAYDRNIVLASPSSLMVALRTVETLWRYEKQNTNAEAIAHSAGKLYDQFVLLIDSIEDIGSYLDKASKAYDTTKKRLVDGRGNVVRRVESLRNLGAKTGRVIPEAYRDEALADELEQSSPDQD